MDVGPRWKGLGRRLVRELETLLRHAVPDDEVFGLVEDQGVLVGEIVILGQGPHQAEP
jgi:hypothetical protein